MHMEGAACPVSFENPLSIFCNRARQSVLCAISLLLNGFPAWRRRFRPYAIGIAGLAIAVVLWGVGYKLSRYHRHATPSSTPVARVWIRSRGASSNIASRLKVKSKSILDSLALDVPIQRLPFSKRCSARALSSYAPVVAFFGFLIPFRSPPPLRFYLA